MQASTDYLTEIMSEQFKGRDVQANPNNKMTKARRALAHKLAKEAETNPEAAFEQSVDLVTANLPAVQRFILSKGETPLSDPIDMAQQAYQLRCQDIQQVADAMGVSFGEAQIYIEGAEANSEEINAPESDNFLGGLFSAIGNIAGNALQQSAIKRAGQGKKGGILGALTPGYDNLKDYLKAHPEMKGKVTLDEQGNIVSTDAYANQLNPAGQVAGGLATDIFATDAAKAVGAAARKAAIKQNLPYIIGGVILLIVVIIFIVRANRHK